MARRRRRSPFERLADKIAGRYRREGYSASRARYIGKATAGAVARRKRRRRR